MHRSAAGLWNMLVQGLAQRKAELKEMVPLNVAGKQRLVFEAPSRGLIGFRSAFATLTRGTGILHRAFSRYGPYKGPLDGVRKGVLISMAGQLLFPLHAATSSSPVTCQSAINMMAESRSSHVALVCLLPSTVLSCSIPMPRLDQLS